MMFLWYDDDVIIFNKNTWTRKRERAFRKLYRLFATIHLNKVGVLLFYSHATNFFE